MGGAELGGLERHEAGRVRGGVVHAVADPRDQQEARASRPKPHRASSAAPIARPRRARWRARCELLETDRRGQVRRATPPTTIRPRISQDAAPRSRAHRRAARHGRARRCGRADPDVAGLRDSPRRRATSDRPGWDVIPPAVASRHASPGRPHRRSRTASRLRASADDLPRCRTGAAAVRSAHRARSPRALGAARHGLLRGDHVRVHRVEVGRAVPGWPANRWPSPIRCRSSSRRCGRACCPASSTRSATIAATAGPTCASSRSARASRPTAKRAAPAFAWTGLATPDHWSGARRAVDFYDIKGVVEQLAAAYQVHAVVRGHRRGYLVAGPRRRDHRQRQADRRLRTTRAGDRRGARSARHGRDLRRRNQSRRVERRGAGRDAARGDAAEVSVGRARRLDSRQRCLVCRNGSWHHSVGRARHADPDPRVRSLSGQGHSGRQGQPVVPPDVPVARANADRRRSQRGHDGAS